MLINEVLELGVPGKNIIILCNQNHESDKNGHRLHSPITAHKLQQAIIENTQTEPKSLIKGDLAPKAPNFSHLKVLAVDDNSVNRMIIRKTWHLYS